MVSEIRGVAQRAAWDTPGEVPPVEEVRPGLWSLPVRIPNNPLRYTLAYAFVEKEGVTLVDPGWDAQESWESLLAGLDVAGTSVDAVRSVVVTHIHPDHLGLGAKVTNRSGGQIIMHSADAAALPAGRGADRNAVGAEMIAVMGMAGAPHDEIAGMQLEGAALDSWVDMPPPDRTLEDAELLPTDNWPIRAIWTPGHSPGHICLFDERNHLLLSGDHVLPRITPNVGLHLEAIVNPLADYEHSLSAVRDLDVEEVLPAHEWRFAPLATRIDELLSHHTRRLEEVRSKLAASPDTTAWELATALTWSRPFEGLGAFMRRAAVGETLAHLAYLRIAQEVTADGETPLHWRLKQTLASRQSR